MWVKREGVGVGGRWGVLSMLRDAAGPERKQEPLSRQQCHGFALLRTVDGGNTGQLRDGMPCGRVGHAGAGLAAGPGDTHLSNHLLRTRSVHAAARPPNPLIH